MLNIFSVALYLQNTELNVCPKDSPYAKHAVNVVPDCSAEHGGVHTLVCRHCIICQIVSDLKLFIKQLSKIWIKSIHKGKAMILPTIILLMQKTYHLLFHSPLLLIDKASYVCYTTSSTCTLRVGTCSPLLEKSL